jgi:hypothetical protein
LVRTETQARRPRANRPGRRAFVSGKRKQNTIKTTTISDGRGRTLWAGRCAQARMHDQTAVTTEGIKELLRYYPTVMARVDTGYRAGQSVPDRVCAPPPKPAKDAPAEEVAAYKQARARQSSRRICVEHAIAEHKQWRPLQRHIGRREVYAQTHLAIAGLVSDRSALRSCARCPVAVMAAASVGHPAQDRPVHRLQGRCWVGTEVVGDTPGGPSRSGRRGSGRAAPASAPRRAARRVRVGRRLPGTHSGEASHPDGKETARSDQVREAIMVDDPPQLSQGRPNGVMQYPR